MKVTLLGTGDATSVPAPLCDCEYCIESDRRRHPAIIVETSDTRLLLDIGPDVQEQLATVGVRSIDAAAITHAHGDHSGGLPSLAQSVKWDAAHLEEVDRLEPTDEEFDPGYVVYLTDTARSHLSERYYDIEKRLRLESIADGEVVNVGDATVKAVPLAHHRPTFQTLGFLIKGASATVLYAPDMRSFLNTPPTSEIDLMVCEGAAVLGQPVHGPADELKQSIDAVDAATTVLVNVNEHLQRSHTNQLAKRAADLGYELGVDFETYDL